MNTEFAQSTHEPINEIFTKNIDLANKVIAFKPSALQISIMRQFIGGHHRITYLTSTFPGRLSLRPSAAAIALDELCDAGYMGFYPSDHKYALVKRGRDYLLMLNEPIELGVKTPPRTYVNAAIKSVYSLPKMNLRSGCQDHLTIKSLPMEKQIQMVAV